jgi:CheY-like chemotaxis protein
MADNAPAGIAGRRLLLVEDDYLIAWDLASWLESKGADVLGPAASVADALMLLTTDSMPDAAVLDISLGDERVFPVADALEAAHVPFVFLSGYDAREVPDSYGCAPRCSKPLDRTNLLRLLAEVITAAD